ncbi:MAG: NAD(P)-dependent alcohol dehydrogenase, partial [Gemmatimonadetes bacterium]|nr:NAD(P)-dependent alcohol dehydrogenase [Gemmatimonadota bacterium]
GVERFKPGDQVFGASVRRNEWMHGEAFAEFVVVPVEHLALKPEGVGFAEAACVPTSGHIALQNLRDLTRTSAGRETLVNGAAGGVGAIALQVIKARGAHVTGVDAAPKLALVRDLGADEVLDYAAEDYTDHHGRYDLIFDVPGNHPFARVRRALKPDGRYVPIGFEDYGRGAGPVLGVIPRFLGLLIRARFTEQLRGPGSALPDRSETLMVLKQLLERGSLTPVVASVRPIAEAAEALRELMAGQTLGRIVLTPDPGLLSQDS